MSTSHHEVRELTAAEVTLLSLLADGVSGSELSTIMNVNPRTIQRRLQRIRAYFDVPTTVEAVVAAVRRELI